MRVGSQLLLLHHREPTFRGGDETGYDIWLQDKLGHTWGFPRRSGWAERQGRDLPFAGCLLHVHQLTHKIILGSGLCWVWLSPGCSANRPNGGVPAPEELTAGIAHLLPQGQVLLPPSHFPLSATENSSFLKLSFKSPYIFYHESKPASI